MAWIKRWGLTIWDKASSKGVWRLKDGGCVIRGRATDPRTGKQHDIRRVLPKASASDAAAALLTEQRTIRSGGLAPRHRQRFSEYATSWLAQKIAGREIRSASHRRGTGSILTLHILPTFGEFYVDQIRSADLKAWRARLGALITKGELSPHSANNRMSALRCCLQDAVEDLDIESDPTRALKKFSAAEHPTYTEDEPGSLKPPQVPAFLKAMRQSYPEHFAICVLGFSTGLRGANLRPIRCKGPSPDLRLDEQMLYVRRSHTDKQEVMDKTKTGKRYTIALPKELCAVLRWQIAYLEAEGYEGELLFPSPKTWQIRHQQSLRRPFASVGKQLTIPYPFTPHGMRRTYQDLMRQAAVADLVTRSISGHGTEAMQYHYSTVGQTEQRGALGKVLKFMGAQKLLGAGGERARSGEKSGESKPEKKGRRKAA